MDYLVNICLKIFSIREEIWVKMIVLIFISYECYLMQLKIRFIMTNRPRLLHLGCYNFHSIVTNRVTFQNIMDMDLSRVKFSYQKIWDLFFGKTLKNFHFHFSVKSLHADKKCDGLTRFFFQAYKPQFWSDLSQLSLKFCVKSD